MPTCGGFGGPPAETPRAEARAESLARDRNEATRAEARGESARGRGLRAALGKVLQIDIIHLKPIKYEIFL